MSARDLAQIKRDVQELVQDTGINTIIRYRQYVTGEYFTAEEQRWTDPFTNWSGVSALKGMVTYREADPNKNIQVGDTKFVIMQSSVSGTLTTSDFVIESGVTHNLKKVSYDPLGIVYLLYTEKAS